LLTLQLLFHRIFYVFFIFLKMNAVIYELKYNTMIYDIYSVPKEILDDVLQEIISSKPDLYSKLPQEFQNSSLENIYKAQLNQQIQS